jgi:hypothetical protein
MDDGAHVSDAADGTGVQPWWLSGMPPIPERVIGMPFHRPFGNMATTGVKRIETRGRAFDRDPCWIAVLNAVRVARLQVVARGQAGAEDFASSRDAEVIGEPGTCPGIVYVSGSRPLLASDVAESFYFEEGRHAWLIEHAVHFRRPVPIAELGLGRVPQGSAWVHGGRIVEAVRSARVVEAPWTADEVEGLNAYQASGRHPFTGRRGPGGEEVVLLASEEGWREAPGGPLGQSWAHGVMTGHPRRRPGP